MKYLFMFSVFVLFLGCADKNAFSKFGMNKAQELSASSIQTSKIKSDGYMDGVFSAIYLNDVYPDKYFDNEYFLISLYIKGRKDTDINLMLNKKRCMKIKRLPQNNEFSDLVGANNRWKKYFLVVFKKEKSTTLSLVLENGQSFSDPLVYQKDKL